MHNHALLLLKDTLKPGCRALDIGAGSGYLTVCMALMVGPSGKVVGLDHIPELVELGKKNMVVDCRADMLDSGQILMVVVEMAGREKLSTIASMSGPQLLLCRKPLSNNSNQEGR